MPLRSSVIALPHAARCRGAPTRIHMFVTPYASQRQYVELRVMVLLETHASSPASLAVCMRRKLWVETCRGACRGGRRNGMRRVCLQGRDDTWDWDLPQPLEDVGGGRTTRFGSQDQLDTMILIPANWTVAKQSHQASTKVKVGAASSRSPAPSSDRPGSRFGGDVAPTVGHRTIRCRLSVRWDVTRWSRSCGGVAWSGGCRAPERPSGSASSSPPRF